MTSDNRLAPFEVLAVAVANVLDSRVPLAACKAGHQGFMNLECADLGAAYTRTAIARLQTAAPAFWGLKIRAAQLGALLASDVLAAAPPASVIVSEASDAQAVADIEQLRGLAPGIRILAEVISEPALQAALALRPDGIVAKGHEAGGRSGDETSLILLQRLAQKTQLPIFAHGGVGTDTVAAFRVAGAAGVVLDWQLALFEAAQTPADITRGISRMDGSETHHIAGADGSGHRVFWRVDHKPGQALKDLADRDPGALAGAVSAQVDPIAVTGPWLVGQDAAFARGLTERYGRLGLALDDLQKRADTLVADAQASKPLQRNSTLAQALGTEFPIVQGPMTRVSDRAPFALSVAEGGALPFLALALMRGQEAKDLVAETKALLADRPWGVGILGFVDDALREEQMQIILDHHPKFALIAGGRPEQALGLEKAGIATFLHVPSPGLLKAFLDQGARRFIFEGRECGGHVGPRTSAVLWQQAIDTLHDWYGDKRMDCQVLFAGGIHDARSAAMVSAMASGIAAQGAEVGALVGSAYIFTEEAISGEAVVPMYQDLCVGAGETVLLESGVGHATRVVQSPIAEEFQSEKKRMLGEGLDHEAVRDTLERFNVGRSRVASKGIDRNPDFGKVDGVEKYVTVSAEDQRRQGVYMIGQVAGLQHAPTTILALHEDISDGAGAMLDALAPPAVTETFVSGPGARVALTGIGTILPKAPDTDTYWQNILDKVDAVSEVPERRWDWRRYFDTNKEAPDKAYSRWGGFVDEIEFDPIRYGIPPNSMTSIEPLQLLALEVVRKALEDAGFKDGKIPDPALRKRTCVIIGVGGGAAPLGQQYAVRATMPALMGDVPEDAKARLPEWTEDSFPGILLNVIAGRVANRFDLGGVNFTVDAACGSSLAAVMTGMREIESGTADMAIVAGMDAFMSPFDFIAFAKTQALSEKGRCRTFDAKADGIAISEGLAAMVLRPVEAAEAAGDRIYAVVRGVAGASDGRDLSLTAPRPEGQQETLRRAYLRAGISPASVGLIEAHGTGTVVGDRTEIQSLSAVYSGTRDDKQFCGVGSVKSMIGHTKAAAGCAGMAKVALALHHRVLPPTLNVDEPSPSANFPESPFYPVTDLRPWIRTSDAPRRAGVSAFGFGGTNFHAVLEEYEGGYLPSHQEPFRKDWPHELLLFSADTAETLAQDLTKAANAFATSEHRLCDIAASLGARFKPDAGARFAMVTGTLAEATPRLRAAAEAIANGAKDLREIDPMGAYFSADAALTRDAIGFVFPGQGSQYPNMASGLAMYFPAMRETLEAAGATLSQALETPLCDVIYPRPATDDADMAAQAKRLMQTNVAQPAIGAVSAGILGLLRSFGAEAGAMVGHSFGELSALSAAGAFTEADLITLAHARGDAIIREGGADLGTMMAVQAGESAIRAALTDVADITFANFNAPDQTVLAGSDAALKEAGAKLESAGLSVRHLPVACAFHSDFVAPARDRLGAAITGTAVSTPTVPVYANETGKPYPDQTGAVAETLTRHLTQPVNFLKAVTEMHNDGVRLFIEVGPNAVLSRLTQRILDDKPHVAVATDVNGRGGPQQLLTALAAMSAAGVSLNLATLWAQRTHETVDVVGWTAKAAKSNPMVWMVDPARSRPIGGTHAKVGISGRIENDPAPVAATALPAPQAQTAAVAAPAAAMPQQPMPQQMPTGAMAEAMQRHHALMAQMLENHAQTMQLFLGGGTAVAASPAAVPAPMPALAQPVAPAVAAPVPQTPVAAPPPVAPPAAAPVAVTAPAVSPEAVTARLLELISDRTGYPPEMLGRELNLEADLGIDSIKRVEILASLRMAFLADAGEEAHEKMAPVSRERTVDGIVAKFMEVVEAVSGPAPAPVPVAVAIAAPTAVAVSPEAVTARLLELISDRTGYPPEMLGRELNLEADLGIDSIKRVEILASLRMAFLADAGEEAHEKMAPVSRERTVDGIVAKFMEVVEAVSGPAPAPVPVAVAVAAPAAVAVSPEAVTARLLELISDRTGYPPEMLGRELNLEADLGIDSIKRVEILASLRMAFLADAGEEAHEKMAPVSRERTVDGIVAKFMEVVEAVSGAHDTAPTEVVQEADTGLVLSNDRTRRFVMTPVLTAFPDPKPWVTAGGLYVLSRDKGGVAVHLADLIHAAGGKTLLIDPDGLTSDTVSQQLDGQTGTVAGILHCAALLNDLNGPDIAQTLISEATSATESLYAMLHALGPDLSARDDALVLSASRMGGTFGFDGEADMAPGAAGAVGLLKTLTKEWPGAHVRAVDLETGCSAENAAQILFDEAGRRDDHVEIGWTGMCRWRLAAAARPVDMFETAVDQDVLTDTSVIFVTGGARGITARCLLWLAQKYRSQFVIAGSSPVPAQEAADTAALTDAGALRAHLAKTARDKGDTIAIAEIERRCRALLKAREIRDTLDALRATGARVDYHSCDVRDATALSALVDTVYDTYGRIDGAIHGAGIVEDKLITDKTSESFRRVMTTKVDSAFHLAAALRPETLKFLVFFTSVAGRFGNRGQGDYGAANEIVSKYARRLSDSLAARVVAVSWGPWDSDGMVSAEIKAQFSALGIEAVPPAIGIRALEAEILATKDQVPEVVWGYGPWAHDMDDIAETGSVKAAE